MLKGWEGVVFLVVGYWELGAGYWVLGAGFLFECRGAPLFFLSTECAEGCGVEGLKFKVGWGRKVLGSR